MNINKLIRTVRKAKANTEEVLTLQLLTEIEVELEYESNLVEAPVKPACVPQERFGIYVSAINRIDDFFEYRYKALTPEEIKKQVMKYIDNITEQLSKSV